MKRRDFLIRSIIAGAAGLTLPVSRLYGAVEGGYTGRLLVQLQADGGWDVASYCDPKVNQPGELEITQWSRTNTIQQAGNLSYAPYANNADLFSKYYSRMLVINGVDAQTNSHSTGVIHNWSGRNSIGYPTLTAMFAANNAPEQPLSYINFGGFAQTGNLIRFSRLNDVDSLLDLLEPERGWEDTTLRSAADLARIDSYRVARLQRKLASDNLTPRQRNNLEAYENALNTRGPLADFQNYLPADNEILPNETVNNQVSSNLKRQVQLAVSAFDAGLASAADLYAFGYDTHTTHDALHEPLFTHLNESIDLLWTLAEERGFADRLTLIIASDFSRTPWYNADNGKDHWPIGSVIVMEQNASWTNRMVGGTDEGQNAYRYNPSTLEQDDTNGTIIYPKHVHKALRRHLGLENTAVDQNFQFLATEDFSFFS